MHFHLHHPIMIGKKKTKDVQFYVEVMEASYSLDQTRRSGYDPDELEEEQRERAMRVRMNQEFQNFVKKVEEQAAHLESNLYFTRARTLTPPPTPTPHPYPYPVPHDPDPNLNLSPSPSP